MKPTGPTRESTLDLIQLLKKHGKKKKEAIWLDLAERLEKARRRRKTVNLEKLSWLARKFGWKDKIMVVPGKVLGKGSLQDTLKVAAYSYSDRALSELSNNKSKAWKLDELVESNVPARELVLVV